MVEYKNNFSRQNPSESLEKKYTVLSLDGGGVRGIMTVEILAELEKKIRKDGHPDFKITDKVDCVIGTSAGGLLALMLAAGYSATELCEPSAIENKESSKSNTQKQVSIMEEIIFDTFQNPSGIIQNLEEESKYNQEGLRKQLREKLNKKLKKVSDDAKMSDLNKTGKKLRVLITAAEFKDRDGGPHITAKIFDSENEYDQDFKLMDIGCATSAAPTFFNIVKISQKLPGKIFQQLELIDGGVYANNPAGIGFAYAAMKVKSENVRVISIGTGYEDINMESKQGVVDKLKVYLETKIGKKFKILDNNIENKHSILDWYSGELLFNVIFDVQKYYALLLETFAKQMNDNYVRINPPLKQKTELDDVKQEENLKEWAIEYLNSENGKSNLEKAAKILMEIEDYNAKALKQLKQTANLLVYAECIDQQPSKEIREQIALFSKFINSKFSDPQIEIDESKLDQTQINIELNLISLIKSKNLVRKQPEDTISQDSTSQDQ
ncbi:patatin [Stylonychia lemnae]|uniref:Patatin n=1 Tax=Stylonychia lemnae TaxID=5949 RepID=A0A078APR6_STYLE|nr:patatin [Stylonychia lemnae]|eukprot:CDW82903.1 patatin [Stylonychia lemnae]